MDGDTAAPVAETVEAPTKAVPAEPEAAPPPAVANGTNGSGNDIPADHEEKQEEAPVEKPPSPSPPPAAEQPEESKPIEPEATPAPDPEPEAPVPVEEEKPEEVKEAPATEEAMDTAKPPKTEDATPIAELEKKEEGQAEAEAEAKTETSDEKVEEKEASETKPAEEPKDKFDMMLSGDSDEKKEEKDSEVTKDEESKKDDFDMMLSGESVEKKKESDDSETKEKDSEEVPDEDKKDLDESSKTPEPKDQEVVDGEADGVKKVDENTSEPPKIEVEPDEIAIFENVTVPDDAKFYEDMNQEELNAIKDNLPRLDTVMKPCCTTCKRSQLPVIGIVGGTFRHPHLGVIVCEHCRRFYGDGNWERPDETDEYCRWCGQGGDILLCDKCPNAFCKKCLNKHLGAKALREIKSAETWECLVCQPKPIQSMKAQYYCLYANQDEIKQRHEKNKAEKAARVASKKQAKVHRDSLAKEKEALIKSPKNFLEENIAEAFKTLDVYQKSLEAERTSCIKMVKEGISVDMATSITRKLRKLYAVTQKNMDLLDRAIVESFVENFPTESTRIHMGRVPRNDPSPKKAPPTPAKKKSKIKVKPKTKSKPKPASKKKVTVKNVKGKKAADAKKKKKKKTIHMNGSPVYDVVTPSLMKKKKRSNDDDVECIDLSDDDFGPPKKKYRPGPASSKKKPGPRSKTGDWY